MRRHEKEEDEGGHGRRRTKPAEMDSEKRKNREKTEKAHKLGKRGNERIGHKEKKFAQPEKRGGRGPVARCATKN